MRKLLLSIAVASCITPLWAQTGPKRLFDDSVMKELSEKKIISRLLLGSEAPSLAPAVDSAPSLLAEVGNFKATVGAEVLRLIPAKPRDTAALLTILTSASTMKGITYWSASRNERRVLFNESYCVESPQRPTRIPDPVFTAVPSVAEMFTFQEDTTFGRNVYRTVISAGAGSFRVRTENAAAITYLFIPVVPEGGLVNHTLIVPTEYGTVSYGIALLRSSFPIGDPRARAESLMNRLVAAADWLEARLGK